MANLRQSPGEIARLEQNAHYYKLMGQPELGLREVELALKQNPDNLQIVNLLARSYEELGKFEAARQLYEEALTRHGPHAVLANNLCFSYYREGRWQEAERCFRQTLAHDPGNVAARNNLGLLYCRLGRQDEARRLWQETEGAAGADSMMDRALAALGMSGGVYAQRPEPTSPAARATQAQTPQKAVSRLPAPSAAKPDPPAQPVTPKASAVHLATEPPVPTPAPVAAKPLPEVRKPAAKPPAAQAAEASKPAPQAAARPRQASLTNAERADTAIEVRNGTRTRNLAHQTRSRLRREGFTVSRIGNHVDFGAAQTIVYYRPGAEKAARTLGQAVFPGAELAQSLKLAKGMDIQVLLGHDLLNNPQFMARLNDSGEPAAPFPKTSPATDKVETAKAEAERSVTGPQEPQGESRIKAGSEQQSLAPKEVAPQPLASPAPKPLTAAERVDTAIEVRNGTWTQNLARQTRTLLHQEGFTVTRIGNHIDFGATKTIIYYRPEAERVARTVGRTVFPQAELSPSPNLKKGTDIRILLGADLFQHPPLTARLVTGVQ